MAEDREQEVPDHSIDRLPEVNGCKAHGLGLLAADKNNVTGASVRPEVTLGVRLYLLSNVLVQSCCYDFCEDFFRLHPAEKGQDSCSN